MRNKTKHILATISMVIVIGMAYYVQTSFDSLMDDLETIEQVARMGKNGAKIIVSANEHGL